MTELSKQERAAIVESLGLTIESRFVPFSQSRNKAEKQPSLNWVVTLLHNGKPVLSTDYMAGIGHAPSNNHKDRAERDHMVRYEAEHGQRALGVRWGHRAEAYGGAGERNAIKPDTLGVLYSLVMDASAIDEGSFENWAASLGYDTDSRKAEQAYRACIDIGLKLRATLGETGLETLRNAFEGY